MILSEFAGAAQSLNGSIVVNPWDSQQVADAIHEAVTIDSTVRAENHRKLFKYVNKYSAAFWGSSFIKEMSKIDAGDVSKEGQAELEVKPGDTAGEGTVITNGTVPLSPGPDTDV
jgi:trehalose 6-phosphate synthase